MKTILYPTFFLALCFLACQPKTLKENSTKNTVQKTETDIPSGSKRPVHWSYEGNKGPNNWGNLSAVYALCNQGSQQSPINIIKNETTGGSNWQFNYKNTSLRIAHNEHMNDIIDNGHTIQVNVEEGSTFELNKTIYHLKQFHFHTPSEHTIDGQHAPMEVHFVHQSKSGQLAVVSVLVKEGPENDNIAKIVANLPKSKGESKHISDVNLSLQFHLPKVNEAYHYVGSLTTPPCSEFVEWLVFKNYINASKKQIAAIASKIGPNNRPIQKLNKRSIQTDALKGQISD